MNNTIPRQSFPGRNGHHRKPVDMKMLMLGVLMLILPILGYLVFKTDKLLIVAGVVGMFVIAISILKPEFATLAVVFVFYSNMAVVMKTLHGIPEALAASFTLLLSLPLANYLFIKKQRVIVDYALLLMVLFGVVCMASAFLMAKDLELSLGWIAGYGLEGLILYFLFLNVIRNLTILRRAVWVLLFCGAMLAAMSLYQEVFNKYNQTFGGLAQRTHELEEFDEFHGDVYAENRDKVGGKNRSGGPVGKPNRYAQVLLVLVPLGLFRTWSEKKPGLKFVAALSTVIILGGVLLTYSRGGFVTMALMFLLLALFRYITLKQILISVVVMLALMAVAAPGYFTRVESITGAASLFSADAGASADGTTRGRMTEMLAAFLAFTDYPILGVGPAQYTPFYSNHYQADPDIAFRHLGRQRRAHTLYFELMAETGVVGFATFVAIFGVLMYRLWHLRHRALRIRPDIAHLAASFWFAIFAYLGTAIFLHLSYQRYYWFLLAIAGATIQVAKKELEDTEQAQTDANPHHLNSN
ncbi:MAG TPA: O-antigen ligase family protein, partial [bacterium]